MVTRCPASTPGRASRKVLKRPVPVAILQWIRAANFEIAVPALGFVSVVRRHSRDVSYEQNEAVQRSHTRRISQLFQTEVPR
jgi:hypothetical protein